MSMRRLTSFIAVVFPAPDGPTRQQMSPAGTVSERSWTAGCAAARIALRHVVEDDLGGRAAHRCSVVGWWRQAERSRSCSTRRRLASNGSSPRRRSRQRRTARSSWTSARTRAGRATASFRLAARSAHRARVALRAGQRLAVSSCRRGGRAGHRALRPRVLVRVRRGLARRPRLRARRRRRRRLRRWRDAGLPTIPGASSGGRAAGNGATRLVSN